MVVLFDIDGTLINSQGAGGAALCLALTQAFGIRAPRMIPLHGRTDLGVFFELLTRNGIEDSEDNFQHLQAAYFDSLPGELKRRGGVILPGVVEMLGQLRQTSGCQVGLLTGNMPVSAQMKLEHFGLWESFEFGIFGDTVAHRPDLSGQVMSVVNNHSGHEVPPQCIIVIGDTPLDVQLARALQARCLAVCTGGFTADELLTAGACRAVDDLSATTDLVAWIFTQTELKL